MTHHDQPPLEVSIDVAASPERVWAEVSDRKAMARRSPELVGMWLVGGDKPGARGVNMNRRKAAVWPTTTKMLQVKPPTHDGSGVYSFRVGPSGVIWSYEIEPDGEGGTRLTERRSALTAPNGLVWGTAKFLLGGEDSHHGELEAGMRTTLAAIKADAER